MSTKDKEYIIRLIDAVTKIPLPNLNSVRGMMDFAEDMRRAFFYLRVVNGCLKQGEPIQQQDIEALERIVNEISR